MALLWQHSSVSQGDGISIEVDGSVICQAADHAAAWRSPPNMYSRIYRSQRKKEMRRQGISVVQKVMILICCSPLIPVMRRIYLTYSPQMWWRRWRHCIRGRRLLFMWHLTGTGWYVHKQEWHLHDICRKDKCGGAHPSGKKTVQCRCDKLQQSVQPVSIFYHSSCYRTSRGGLL